MDHEATPRSMEQSIPASTSVRIKHRYTEVRARILPRLCRRHARTAYVRCIPLPALLIIAFVAFVNCTVWAICAAILHDRGEFIATGALAYSLGLRHALDADHISAIDLMTRRLLASDPRSRPVTVGTWFSLGHSTIVIITSVVVAATAAGISSRFGSFGTVGGIIGTSVSAAFLILLGLMNGYILYRLIVQLHLILAMPVGEESSPAALKFEGGGPVFRVLKRMFKLINKPWKMYPLGVLFGLGFDTSSEIALLGISSIQATKGTSIWIIMVFPILFTAGMCLIDTMDGALMLAVYVAPLQASGTKNQERNDETQESIEQVNAEADKRLKDPILFLYYSIVLTCLTVIVALVIGTIQLLSLVLNVAHVSGPFWDGVETASDDYDIIGGAICGSFIVFGGLSVLCYKPWRRKVDERRQSKDLLRRDNDAIGEETDTEAGTMCEEQGRKMKDAACTTEAASPKRTDEPGDR